MIVVDASVAVKWFIKEPLSDVAMTLLDSAETLIAPELVRLEVTSAIVRNCRDSVITEGEAKIALQKLETSIQLESLVLFPDEEFWDAGVALALSLKHTFLDCLYLALGQRESAKVITHDDNMYKRGKKAGIKTTLLSELSRQLRN